MEQARLSTATQQQHQQQKHVVDTAAVSTREADDEAFDSVRQAAVGMFKQRTKDLTQLTKVESQRQSIDAEVERAEGCVAQLAAQQASLEALVEEEQQRTRHRESRLQELHGSLVELDAELRTNLTLQRAAENAIGAATGFIARFTDADGRLFLLLSEAKARAAGRSAGELQKVREEVQKACATVTAHQEILLTPTCASAPACLLPERKEGDGSTTPPSVVCHTSGGLALVCSALRKWAMSIRWEGYPELSGVMAKRARLLEWLGRHGDPNDDFADRNTAVEEDEAGEHQRSARQLLPLSASATVALTKDVCFDQLQLPVNAEAERDSATEERSKQTDEVVETMVAHLVPLRTHIYEPLQAMLDYHAPLAAKCARRGVELSDELRSLPRSVAAAQQQWTTFESSWHQWRGGLAEVRTAEELARSATAELAAARSDLHALQHLSQEEVDALEAHKTNLTQGKEVELDHYADAVSRGFRAWHAARTTLLSKRCAIAALIEENAAVKAAADEAAAKHTRDVEEGEAELTSFQCELKEVQKKLEAAMLQEEMLEAQHMGAAKSLECLMKQRDTLLTLAAKPVGLVVTAKGDLDDHMTTEGAVSTCAEFPVAQEVAHVLQALSASALILPPHLVEYVARVKDVVLRLQEHTTPEDSDGAAGAQVTKSFMALVHRWYNVEAASQSSACEVGLTDDTTAQAALQGLAVSLQLPIDLFDENLFDEELLQRMPCLHALQSEVAEADANARDHAAFMCDARKEMELLRAELVSETA